MSGRVWQGDLHVSVRSSNLHGWVIEVWQDGKPGGPVHQDTMLKKPRYVDKKAALNHVLAQRERHAKKDSTTDAFDQARARADEAIDRRLK